MFHSDLDGERMDDPAYSQSGGASSVVPPRYSRGVSGSRILLAGLRTRRRGGVDMFLQVRRSLPLPFLLFGVASP
jgi:hypothetical protein